MPIRLECAACGATCDAACGCGAGYLSSKARAARALADPANAGKSDRAIAAAIGVDHKTVGAARSTGEYSPVERVISLNGRSYPATQPKRAKHWADKEGYTQSQVHYDKWLVQYKKMLRSYTVGLTTARRRQFYQEILEHITQILEKEKHHGKTGKSIHSATTH